jgi:hypothetical protein
MNPVCPNPGLERYFPRVGRSRIFLFFAGIAKGLHLFLSSCVSASRHREERPGTLSRKHAFSNVHKRNGEGYTYIMFLLLKVVNPPYGEGGYDD